MNKVNNVFTKLLAVSLLSLSSVGVLAESKTDNKLLTSADKVLSPINMSEDKKVLMEKLGKLNFFKANFTQKIFSESGAVITAGHRKASDK